MEAQGARPEPPATAAQPAAEETAVTLASEELAWVQARAEREGTPVAAVVTETVRRARQLEAWREGLAWLDEGQSPLTADELEAVEREWPGSQG